MDDDAANEPTVNELIDKALAANVLDEESAAEIRGHTDLQDAIGAFYHYVYQLRPNLDPEALLRDWGIIE